MEIPPIDRPSRARRRGCLWLLSRGVIAFLIFLGLAVPSGLIYQAASLRLDQRRYPPPGELIDIGGFRLHIVCIGSGSPTVVLDAGLGDSSYIWTKIQEPAAQQTRVCAYDRPGLGWSDFVRQPFGRVEVADNLHQLLQNAAIPGPYILVGHSMGGMYVREFANRYPQDTAGLVFVDSTHENQSRRLEGGRTGFGGSLDGLLSACRMIAPTGVFRVFGLGDSLVGDTGLPDTVRAAAIATLNRNTYCSTIANELHTSDEDVSQIDKPKSLGDIPLVVLMAGRGFSDGGDGPPGMDEAERRRSDDRWLRLQNELASLSTRGKLSIAAESGHYIHLDQPDLVLAAILDLVQTVRRSTGGTELLSSDSRD